MAACWRSVTPCVILLHRPSVPVVAILDIQGVIKMAAEGFYCREADRMPHFDFSEEKFMFKRTWQVVFSAARNYFRHPKTTCRSPEGSGRAPLQSRCAWKRKNRNKKWENEHCNIQICFQEMGTVENMNAIYPCFQSIVNRIFSSCCTVWRNLFSATESLVCGVRCMLPGLDNEFYLCQFVFLMLIRKEKSTHSGLHPARITVNQAADTVGKSRDFM